MKFDGLTEVVEQFSVQCIGSTKRRMVSVVIVAVEYCVYLFERTHLNVFGEVSTQEDLVSVPHDLQWLGTELAVAHLYIGRMQPVSYANLVEVEWLRFITFADDKNPVIARSLRFPADKLPRLSGFRLIVLPHWRVFLSHGLASLVRWQRIVEKGQRTIAT